MRFFLTALIAFYQKTLSPDHGMLRYFFRYGYCRFAPSCSEYARVAIEQHGVLKGVAWALWRLLRCNPWNKGGIDRVPYSR